MKMSAWMRGVHVKSRQRVPTVDRVHAVCRAVSARFIRLSIAQVWAASMMATVCRALHCRAFLERAAMIPTFALKSGSSTASRWDRRRANRERRAMIPMPIPVLRAVHAASATEVARFSTKRHWFRSVRPWVELIRAMKRSAVNRHVRNLGPVVPSWFPVPGSLVAKRTSPSWTAWPDRSARSVDSEATAWAIRVARVRAARWMALAPKRRVWRASQIRRPCSQAMEPTVLPTSANRAVHVARTDRARL